MQKYMSDQGSNRWSEPYAVLTPPMLLTTNFHHDILMSEKKKHVLIKTSVGLTSQF